jgi:hypothetical protein
MWGGLGLTRKQAAIAVLVQDEADLSARADAGVSEINASCAALQRAVIRRKGELLGLLEAEAAKKRGVLSSQRAALERVLGAAMAAIAVSARILDQGTAAEVLLCKSSMMTGLGLAINHKEPLAPQASTNILFVKNDLGLASKVAAFGAVTAVDPDHTTSTVTLTNASVNVGDVVRFKVKAGATDGGVWPNPLAVVTATLRRGEAAAATAGGGEGDGSGGGHSAAHSQPLPTAALAVADVGVGECWGTFTAPDTAASLLLDVRVCGSAVGNSPIAIQVRGGHSLRAFEGIVTEADGLSIAALKADGWVVAYNHPYSHCTTFAELTKIKGMGKKALVAAAKAGSDVLYVAAMGDADAIFAETHSRNKATLHNGAYWYNSQVRGGKSFGYAPEETVFLSSTDCHDNPSNARLSWYTAGTDGGYRAGDVTSWGRSGEWLKLIFVSG